MAQIIPFPYRASKLAYLPTEDYFEALLAEALVLETAHNLAPDDEEILHRLMTARALIIALQTEETAMPSEQPSVTPFDTHARALAGRGANQDLHLAAYEVAELSRPSRVVERLLEAAIVIGVILITALLIAELIYRLSK
jgi:hypothetical protein